MELLALPPPQQISNKRRSTKQGIAWEERHVANRHMCCKSAAGHDKRWSSRYALPPRLAGLARLKYPLAARPQKTSEAGDHALGVSA